MSRVVVPSPNEEAQLLLQAQQRRKVERLKAARTQAVDWSKRRTASHKAVCKERTILHQRRDVQSKLNTLTVKECTLKSEIENALAEVGKSYDGADDINSQQLDQQKADELAEFSRRAAQRHRAALKRLNKLKEESENKENIVKELKVKVKEEEKLRTKSLLENPLQNSQPLIEVPSRKVHKQLKGLDAFTKTYFHLPKAGIGIIDEKSLDPHPEKTAKDVAKETDNKLGQYHDKLQESKQAREERADVRGASALQKVQLNNILEDVTSRLDKYAIYKRTRKARSNPDVNIFASNLARSHAKKKHQVELEHAVEEIFDSDTLALLLPKHLDVIEEQSDTGSVVPDPVLDKSVLDDTEPSETHAAGDETDEDNLPAESRPSLNLYFPLCSDISSASEATPRPDRHEGAQTDENALPDNAQNQEHIQPDKTQKKAETIPDMDLERNNQADYSAYKSEISSFTGHSVSLHSHRSLSTTLDTTTDSSVGLQDSLSLSDKIQKQIEKNEQLAARDIGSVVKLVHTPDPQSGLQQPPPISFTKTSPNTSHHSSDISQRTLSSLSLSSTASKSMSSSASKSMSSSVSKSSSSHTSSFSDRIIQELLTSDPESTSSPLQKPGAITINGLSDSVTSKNNGSVSPCNGHDLSQQSTETSDKISQHVLSDSQNSSNNYSNLSNHHSNISSNYGNVSKVSSGESFGNDSVMSNLSVSSGLSNLQKQLTRITAHLREIEKIKANDDKLISS